MNRCDDEFQEDAEISKKKEGKMKATRKTPSNRICVVFNDFDGLAEHGLGLGLGLG